uniref:Putative single-stranded DNA-binding protein n=1 Tax=viral metagenome TaxID=1070528 RepID=A0A6M3IGG9_9ZZZZ
MRSLNSVELIGNLTRDPELTKTNNNTSVCNFNVATDRSWTTAEGEKKEETEFTRVIAWQKLAEICGAMLWKGSKVYISGRLLTRKFTGQDGVEKTSTEVVCNDMICLSPKKEVVEEKVKEKVEEKVDKV